MKSILTGLVFTLFLSSRASANIHLAILVRPGSTTVTLRWNMTDYPGLTTYALFESPDGVTWNIAAANPAERRYTGSTIMQYRKKFTYQKELYFRVKVYDLNQNIIAISNTALVVNPEYGHPRSSSYMEPTTPFGEAPTGSQSYWQLETLQGQQQLDLRYVGLSPVKGVINVDIYDSRGKVVQRFRASSKERRLAIPIRQLQRGTYHVVLNVEGQKELNTYFSKF
ncbi:MAG: hypothetical protein KGM98_01285 [Bacteroidota bacterium]|nr:hypothetical protein [Bacteroidota bacterium]